MAKISIHIPEDVQTKLKNQGSDVAGTLRLAAAFSLCQRGELSTSQAARLAGLTYADFLEAAARAQIELFPVDLEELKEEIQRGYTLGHQCVASDLAGRGRAT
jgi:predicted HTH domain antitoxin